MKTAEEKLNFDLPEMPSLNIDAVISRFIQEQQKKEEESYQMGFITYVPTPQLYLMEKHVGRAEARV